MTQSVQLYLTGPVAERDLLGSLAEFMGIGLETIDFPSDQAQGFVMVMRSGGDYPFGIMISWSDALNLGVDSVGLAQRIAARYGVCVAMDPIQGQDVGRYHEDDPYLPECGLPIRRGIAVQAGVDRRRRLGLERVPWSTQDPGSAVSGGARPGQSVW